MDLWYDYDMKKLLLVFTTSLILGGCTVQSLFNKSPAGLDISTTPVSTVFLNGKNVGNTPYSDKSLAAGSYTVKLVPEAGVAGLEPYETKVTLAGAVSTVISHTFAVADTDTQGYTLSLQQDPTGKTALSVISDPDTVTVTIDGTPHGFTPLSSVEIAPGAHQVNVVSPGYVAEDVSVNAVKGYNLVINIKLASQTISLAPATTATVSAEPSPVPSPTIAARASSSPSPSPTPEVTKPYVVVNQTGTGWLRVRKDASATSDELGKANVGEKLPYLGVTTDTGWFKVQFEGQPGYVSGQYITLVK